jgi:anti-sigma regulatory factor (Ser/Thr protein kinase)
MNPFVHEALLYRDAGSYVAGTVPFIRDGLEAGEPVLVAVPAELGELIRTELGWRAVAVRFLDMRVDGRNPARIIPAVLHAFAHEHAGQPVRIVGEPIWPGRSATEYPACVQHEALINVVFDGTAAAILCPYDARGLEPEVLADAARTHPVLVNGGDRRDSRQFDEPVQVAAAFNEPLPSAPMTAAIMVFDSVDDLAGVRAFVAGHAVDAGLPPDRVVNLQIAANELATNTITHTGGPGAVRVWRDDGHVVCEVHDGGHISDPLAGRLPPAVNSEGGRGLLLTNYLCDLVRIHTVPGATIVRTYMTLS